MSIIEHKIPNQSADVTDLYAVVARDDHSFGLASRCSIKAVTSGDVSKWDVQAIMRNLTVVETNSERRSYSAARKRRRDSGADVVWAYVYLNAEDWANNLYICRSMWISETLPNPFRPSPMAGEDIGDGIVVEWNSNYRRLSEFLQANAVDNDRYLAMALPLAESVEKAFDTLMFHLSRLGQADITEDEFLNATVSSRDQVERIDGAIMELPFAPIELKAFGNALKEVGAYVGNIAMHYSDVGLQTWDQQGRLQNSLNQVPHAKNALRRMKFELRKFGDASELGGT